MRCSSFLQDIRRWEWRDIDQLVQLGGTFWGECAREGVDYPSENFLGCAPFSTPCCFFLQADGILHLPWNEWVHVFECTHQYLGEAVLLGLVSLRQIIDVVHVDIYVLEAGGACRWGRRQMVEAVHGEVRCIWFKAGGKGGIGFVDNSFGCGTEQIW